MTTEQVRAVLTGGDRRSLGRSQEVVELIPRHPAVFPSLIQCLWDPDPVVRMRAADAAEKASVKNQVLLQPHKAELLGLLNESTQQEVRWHLCLMIPRLRLTREESHYAAATLQNYFQDRSSIVKTFAMQGIFDLALQDADLRSLATEQIDILVRSGTPAMKARGRKLLHQLENPAPASR